MTIRLKLSYGSWLTGMRVATAVVEAEVTDTEIIAVAGRKTFRSEGCPAPLAFPLRFCRRTGTPRPWWRAWRPSGWVLSGDWRSAIDG